MQKISQKPSEQHQAYPMSHGLKNARNTAKKPHWASNTVYFILIIVHDSLVLHRDIKTENILIDDNETIKIIDFNVSMQLPTSSPMITITDKFVGTKAYAPPELVIPQNKARTINGMKVDVWALGITFYELIERNHPWTGKTID